MKIISIIGTRPQYIKVKPISDYCYAHKIDHIIIDTNQHYTDSVSKKIIESLNLKIDFNLYAKGSSEVEFICDASLKLEEILTQISRSTDIFVIVYGDTNSSFAAALTCYKNKILFAHVEAGVRCFDNTIPEEINRQYIDSISTINFCTTPKDLNNLSSGISIVSGDLEYELLNSMEPTGDYSKYSLMTIHRQHNVNQNVIEQIFSFCEGLGPILFPIHHRLSSQKWFNSIIIPDNIKICDPLDYKEMVNVMTSCKFILTDSGGVLKTSAFFGKKTLILRSQVGWVETISNGYAKVCEFTDGDRLWISEKAPIRNPNLYVESENASKIIIQNIINFNEKR